MIVCIDTNVLIQAAKKSHPFAVIIRAWLHRKFVWAVSNEILLEYQEIIVQRSGEQRWKELAHLLSLAEKRGGMLLQSHPAFRFMVISNDPDDNKFTDCAITAHADYLITEDVHFALLSKAGYKPQPILPASFIQRHLETH